MTRRILWADDQRDVARTMSELLKPLRCNVLLAGSGTEVLERCATSEFDLIILDLQMPPGDWGGLWVLERLSAARVSAPVLVLSGEGGQQETIRALRLGAEDYVLKSAAASELAPRVASLLATSEDRLAEWEGSLPTPVALALGRFRSEREPGTRLRRLLQVQESVARHCALVALCLRIGPNEPSELARIRELLRSPSFGDWVSLARRVRKWRLLSDETSGVFGAFDWRKLDGFVRVRNDLHHGGEVGASRLLELLDDATVETARLLGVMCRHGFPTCVEVSRIDYTGQHFDVFAACAVGQPATLPTCGFSSETPLVTGHSYIRCFDGPVASAWPYLIMKSGTSDGASWQYCSLDGFRDTATGNEELRYVEARSGSRLKGVGGTLKELQQRLAQ